MVNVHEPTTNITTSILFIVVSYSSASFRSNRPISTSSLAMWENVLPAFKARSGSSRHSNIAIRCKIRNNIRRSFCDRTGASYTYGKTRGRSFRHPIPSKWLACGGDSGSAHLGISDVLGSDDFVPPPRAWPIVVYLPEWCLHRGAHGGHTASRQPAELGLTRRERIPPENMMGVQSPSGTAPRLSRHVGLLDPAGGGRCALLVRPICRFLVGLYCGLSGFRVDQCFRRRERHRIEGWHLSRDRNQDWP